MLCDRQVREQADPSDELQKSGLVHTYMKWPSTHQGYRQRGHGSLYFKPSLREIHTTKQELNQNVFSVDNFPNGKLMHSWSSAFAASISSVYIRTCDCHMAPQKSKRLPLSSAEMSATQRVHTRPDLKHGA